MKEFKNRYNKFLTKNIFVEKHLKHVLIHLEI
jgi:hypothetical protein